MSFIQMTAAVDFDFHGRRVEEGTTFYATPIEAAALRYQRQAFAIVTKVPRNTPPKTTRQAPRSKRTYKRRDMVPEP